MEFGWVPDNELHTVDFSLPPEPAGNMKVLGGMKYENPRLYIGCARWGTPQWVGKIYPPNTKDKEFLAYYVQHFNCIELNATHYKVNEPEAILKWKVKAEGRDFLFCPKMFKGVTHQGSLQNKQATITEFLNGIRAFGENLGPVFIQLSDTFGPERKQELFSFLQTLPADINFFLELRHPEWFLNEKLRRELFNTLYQLKIGAVITDTAGRRECAHMHLTIPKVFVRYVGNNMHPTDYPRIDAWIERIKMWLDNGLQQLFFIMHMEDEICAPEMTVYMADKLKELYGIDVQKPSLTGPDKKPEGGQIKFFE
jgi:uncharacterized protein YecE (DUF72 family)